MLALTAIAFAACNNEPAENNTNTTQDTGQYVDPQTGSTGMTIPDRDTPYIETKSPQILKKIDSNMQQGDTQPQAY